MVVSPLIARRREAFERGCAPRPLNFSGKGSVKRNPLRPSQVLAQDGCASGKNFFTTGFPSLSLIEKAAQRY
jgi:hypothetical protein